MDSFEIGIVDGIKTAAIGKEIGEITDREGRRRAGVSIGLPYLVGVHGRLEGQKPGDKGWSPSAGIGLGGPFIGFTHRSGKSKKKSKKKD